MTTLAVVIPVKNGERYLEEVLAAVRAQSVDEILVIDSGSRDRSLQIVRDANVELVQVEPHAFQHGRTRNFGVARTSSELVCFLTQDATPLPGWTDAYREAFALDERVGAAYGPHVPRPDASPMIARELEEFFAGFSPDGRPVVQRLGDDAFLSNVNACYARNCWEQVRFREVTYSEDQAFGRDLLRAGWRKVYHPAAAVLHSHDYAFADFMRRYFDEYRGLRQTIGHVEPFSLKGAVAHAGRSVIGDQRWLRSKGASARTRARWVGPSAAHHGGRRMFSALGSQADRVPPPVRRRLSLEARDHQGRSVPVDEGANLPDLPLRPTTKVAATTDHELYSLAAEVWRRGAAPLRTPRRGTADRSRLRIAMLIPPFSRGSGGHSTLFELLSRLERRGHLCTVWIHDYLGGPDSWPAAVVRHDVNEFFPPISGPVYSGFSEWHGTDVVLATGWQTVHPALLLDRSYARVYLVNDHEPEFYATSAESLLAADTYRHGLHCIAGTPWLRDMLIDRYGATAETYEYGVNHEVYCPRPVTRSRDTIVYYARLETPRRAVPIGLLALAELHRRRPGLRIVMFGSDEPLATSFPYEHAGIASPIELSWLYSEAAVGLSLSLTNFSLIPKEMMACGLPCVELTGASAESIFGGRGPLELAPPDPGAIADSVERLLDDRDLWRRRSREGEAFVASHTWDRATDQVEAGIRHALKVREAASV
jgi:glycosyltransferase involved in cell wall biosynthesis/GT2 family glycosyltransferase